MQYNKNRNDLKLRHCWPLCLGGVTATGGVEVDGVVYFKGTLRIKLDGSEEWTKITSSPYTLSTQTGTTWKVGENGEEHYYLPGLKTYQYLVRSKLVSVNTGETINTNLTASDTSPILVNANALLFGPLTGNRIYYAIGSHTGQWFGSKSDSYDIGIGSYNFEAFKANTFGDFTIQFYRSKIIATYDDEVLTRPATTTGQGELCICGSYSFSSGPGLFGHTTVEQDDTMKMDLVPCIFQNEYGMFDYVTKSFVPSSSTTPFDTVMSIVGNAAEVNSESISYDFLTVTGATTLHLDRPIVTTLGNSSYIPDTITRIEVPAAVYSQYITATNWSLLSSKIYAY